MGRFIEVELRVEEADVQGSEHTASLFLTVTCIFAHFGKLHSVVRLAPPFLDGFALAQQEPGFGKDARLHPIGPVSAGPSDFAPPGGTFHPDVSSWQAPARIRQADALVLLDTRGAAAEAYPTAKIYDCLAARRHQGHRE